MAQQGKRYIITAPGTPPFYVVKNLKSPTGYAWLKGGDGVRARAVRFATLEDAQRLIDRRFKGANKRAAEVVEVDA